MNNKIFGLLIATVMLFEISCSQNEPVTDPGEYGDEVTVTLSVSTEGKMVSSRADSDAVSHISDGTKADMLIYAVYTPTSDGSGFNLLAQYGLGISEEHKESLGANVTASEGQTILYTNKLLDSEGETITLRLMRGKTYYIAFWAQSCKSTAYDTSDLEKVEVIYENAKNNDELRDAFCTVYSFEAQPNTDIHVVLTRAMAQINVGTAGWDYIKEVEYGNRYVYSKIEIEGAYKYINLLTNKVITEGDDATTTVTYDWAKIPAYINTDIPTDDKNKVDNEEFLKVKLTTEVGSDSSKYDGGYLKYLEDMPKDESAAVDGVYTEIFKYLSMCYVLAPSNEAVSGGESNKRADANYGTALPWVSFYMSETEDGMMLDGKTPERLFRIANVPAQRNWRTNILGGTGKDNSIFDPREVTIFVDVVPGYDGDHNYNKGDNKWTENKKKTEEDNQ